jgi:hypothetical protein
MQIPAFKHLEGAKMVPLGSFGNVIFGCSLWYMMLLAFSAVVSKWLAKRLDLAAEFCLARAAFERVLDGSCGDFYFLAISH